MFKRILFMVWVLLIMLMVGFYNFAEGMKYGIAKYKQSKNFMMTLHAMYIFGVADGSATK